MRMLESVVLGLKSSSVRDKACRDERRASRKVWGTEVKLDQTIFKPRQFQVH